MLTKKNQKEIMIENKIPEDEPVFLLRAQDVTAPSIVRQWATQRMNPMVDPKNIYIAEPS